MRLNFKKFLLRAATTPSDPGNGAGVDLGSSVSANTPAPDSGSINPSQAVVLGPKFGSNIKVRNLASAISKTASGDKNVHTTKIQAADGVIKISSKNSAGRQDSHEIQESVFNAIATDAGGRTGNSFASRQGLGFGKAFQNNGIQDVVQQRLIIEGIFSHADDKFNDQNRAKFDSREKSLVKNNANQLIHKVLKSLKDKTELSDEEIIHAVANELGVDRQVIAGSSIIHTIRDKFQGSAFQKPAPTNATSTANQPKEVTQTPAPKVAKPTGTVVPLPRKAVSSSNRPQTQQSTGNSTPISTSGSTFTQFSRPSIQVPHPTQSQSSSTTIHNTPIASHQTSTHSSPPPVSTSTPQSQPTASQIKEVVDPTTALIDTLPQELTGNLTAIADHALKVAAAGQVGSVAAAVSSALLAQNLQASSLDAEILANAVASIAPRINNAIEINVVSLKKRRDDGETLTKDELRVLAQELEARILAEEIATEEVANVIAADETAQQVAMAEVAAQGATGMATGLAQTGQELAQDSNPNLGAYAGEISPNLQQANPETSIDDELATLKAKMASGGQDLAGNFSSEALHSASDQSEDGTVSENPNSGDTNVEHNQDHQNPTGQGLEGTEDLENDEQKEKAQDDKNLADSEEEIGAHDENPLDVNEDQKSHEASANQELADHIKENAYKDVNADDLKDKPEPEGVKFDPNFAKNYPKYRKQTIEESKDPSQQPQGPSRPLRFMNTGHGSQVNFPGAGGRVGGLKISDLKDEDVPRLTDEADKRDKESNQKLFDAELADKPEDALNKIEDAKKSMSTASNARQLAKAKLKAEARKKLIKALVKAAMPWIGGALLAALFFGCFIALTTVLMCAIAKFPPSAAAKALLPKEFVTGCGGDADGANASCPLGYTGYRKNADGTWSVASGGNTTVGNGSVDSGTGTDGISCLVIPRSGKYADPPLRAIARSTGSCGVESPCGGDEYVGFGGGGGAYYGRYQYGFPPRALNSWDDDRNSTGNTDLPSASEFSKVAEASVSTGQLDVKFKVAQDKLFMDVLTGTTRGNGPALMEALKSKNVGTIARALDSFCSQWNAMCDEGTQGGKATLIAQRYLKLLPEEESGSCGQKKASIENKTPDTFATVTNNFKQFFEGVKVEAANDPNSSESKELISRIKSGKITGQYNADADTLIADVQDGLDKNLVKLLLAISDKYSYFAINTIKRGHAAGTLHEVGKAVDIGSIEQGAANPEDIPVNKIIELIKYAQATGVIEETGVPASSSIQTTADKLGVKVFADGPGHIHFGVSDSGTFNGGGSTLTSASTSGGAQVCCPPGVSPGSVSGSTATPTGNNDKNVDASLKGADPNILALMETIAIPESKGRYDIRFPSTTFNDVYHPAVVGCDGPLCSDAAGKFQMLSYTWLRWAVDSGLAIENGETAADIKKTADICEKTPSAPDCSTRLEKSRKAFKFSKENQDYAVYQFLYRAGLSANLKTSEANFLDPDKSPFCVDAVKLQWASSPCSKAGQGKDSIQTYYNNYKAAGGKAVATILKNLDPKLASLNFDSLSKINLFGSVNAYAQSSKDFQYKSKDGNTVSGTLYLPSGFDKATYKGNIVILGHDGFGGSFYQDNLSTGQKISDKGSAVFVINYESAEASRGGVAQIFSNDIDDTIAAMNALQSQLSLQNNFTLAGTSRGAGVSALAAARDSRVTKLDIAYPVSSISNYKLGSEGDKAYYSQARANTGGDLSRLDLINNLPANKSVQILVGQGDSDTVLKSSDGSGDPNYLQHLRDYVNALKAAGYNVVYNEYAGEDHGFVRLTPRTAGGAEGSQKFIEFAGNPNATNNGSTTGTNGTNGATGGCIVAGTSGVAATSGNLPSNGKETLNSGTYDGDFLKRLADNILNRTTITGSDCYAIVGDELQKVDPEMVAGLDASEYRASARMFHDFMQQTTGGVPNYVRYGYEYSKDLSKLQRGSIVVISGAINADRGGDGDINIFIGKAEMASRGNSGYDGWMGRPMNNESLSDIILGIYTKIKK
ncbi:MAG: hypothetical protein WCK98_04030 [bacterium]